MQALVFLHSHNIMHRVSDLYFLCVVCCWRHDTFTGYKLFQYSGQPLWQWFRSVLACANTSNVGWPPQLLVASMGRGPRFIGRGVWVSEFALPLDQRVNIAFLIRQSPGDELPDLTLNVCARCSRKRENNAYFIRCIRNFTV